MGRAIPPQTWLFRVQSLLEPGKRQTGWDSPTSHSQRAQRPPSREARHMHMQHTKHKALHSNHCRTCGRLRRIWLNYGAEGTASTHCPYRASFNRPLSCKFGGGQIGTARSGPWVLLRGTTRRPSACGSPRVHTSLPPREDHASNLVGPVRGIIGLVRRRRLFRAVRHIGRK